MDHPHLKFILRLPDGKIQLATQPHLDNKKYMACPYCPASIIYKKGRNQAVCTKCHNKVSVKKEKEVLVPCQKCQSSMELVSFAGLTIPKCSACGYVPRI